MCVCSLYIHKHTHKYICMLCMYACVYVYIYLLTVRNIYLTIVRRSSFSCAPPSSIVWGVGSEEREREREGDVSLSTNSNPNPKSTVRRGMDQEGSNRIATNLTLNQDHVVHQASYPYCHPKEEAGSSKDKWYSSRCFAGVFVLQSINPVFLVVVPSSNSAVNVCVQ